MVAKAGTVAAFRPRGEATRQRLLDEAERQFAEAGFRGTSLNGIAAACGVGNAGALYHFASKEKLYKAVLERLSADMNRAMDAILAEPGSAAERLRHAIRTEAAHVIAEPGRDRLILRELMDNLGRIEHARSVPLSHWTRSFCRLIAEAQAEGAAAPGEPAVLLALFLGTLSYALVVRPTFVRLDLAPGLQEDARRWLEAAAAAAERALLIQAKPNDRDGREP